MSGGKDGCSTKASRRKTDWDLAKWDEGFDGEIRNLAEADLNRPEHERRVFFAKKELGMDWAGEEIANESWRAKAVERMISADGALDPDETDLLPGLAEKLAKLGSGEERLKVALKDVRNHTLAGEEVGADISVEPAAFRELVVGLASENAQPLRDPGAPTLEGWRELVELVHDLRPLRSPAGVDELLALKDSRQIQREIDRLLMFESPRAELGRQLGAGPSLPPWWEELDMRLPLQWPLDLLSLILLILGEPAEVVAAPQIFKLAYAIGRAGDTYGHRDELVKDPVHYDGSPLPLLLAYKDPSATIERLDELRRRLGQEGENQKPF